jgi:phosphoribosyl-ATP pyrophosphohydrolase/phosphoribosyl-AMP cyclohydrolase
VTAAPGDGAAACLTLDWSRLDFAKGNGHVTVVAQDALSGAVLMVAHADREAIELTLATGEVHYRSRTRGLWHKGTTSGHVQRVVSLSIDCDGDALLARVEADGPSCHTGTVSCFGREAERADALAALDATIEERAVTVGEMTLAPAPPSYTRRLLLDRNLRLKKLGEEAAELVLACADGDRERAIDEAADVLFHVAVALHAVNASLSDVRARLGGRARGRRRADRAREQT